MGTPGFLSAFLHAIYKEAVGGMGIADLQKKDRKYKKWDWQAMIATLDSVKHFAAVMEQKVRLWMEVVWIQKEPLRATISKENGEIP